LGVVPPDELSGAEAVTVDTTPLLPAVRSGLWVPLFPEPSKGILLFYLIVLYK